MGIMDGLKGKIDEIVDKVKNDKDIAAKFKANPIATVESLIGMDLPDDKIQGIVETVKNKVSMDKVGDALGGLFGKK